MAHAGYVPAEMVLAEFVQARFGDDVHYLAVIREGTVFGTAFQRALPF